MKTFRCRCNARLFFENSQCVSCAAEVGWCPACDTLRAIAADASGQYFCTDPSCGIALTKCHNFAVEQVCNRCVQTESDAPSETLCSYCRFNDTIPDLSVDGNREKWQRIEIAKRRLLYTLDRLGIAPAHHLNGVSPSLSFDFKGDPEPGRRLWLNFASAEQVFTGHANGKVTINIREADDVEREKARVAFGEAHRSLIGHFRHEMGHYYWDLLVKGQREAECVALFGNHDDPDYGTALEHYYENGAAPGWQETHISGYATMHPWEDFAESFAAYLDIVAVVDIAYNTAPIVAVDPTTSTFAAIASQHSQLGLVLNEMNRTMGLLDLVPQVYTAPILAKIEFIHDLIRDAAAAGRDAAQRTTGSSAH